MALRFELYDFGMLRDAKVYTKTMLALVIQVNDLKDAKIFYGGMLGLRIHEVTEMTFELDINFVMEGKKIGVLEVDDYEAPDYDMLNFIVEDIDTVVDVLSAKGVTFERFQFTEAPQDHKNIARAQNADQADSAWVKDPSGNIHRIVEAPKESTIILPPKPTFLMP